MAFQRIGDGWSRGSRLAKVVLAAGLFGVLAPTSSTLGQRCTPAQLLDPAGAALDSLGESVAIDGDTAIVGAPKDSFCGNGDPGTAHIYRWGASGWTHEATLVSPDGSRCDHIGVAVAISGDTVAVGGADEVCIFVRSPGTGAWTAQATLRASDGAFGDGFGYSVALVGDWLVVGALGDDIGASADQGSAYLFTRSGTIWTQTLKFTAADGAAGDRFGCSVSMSAYWVLIGAERDDVGTAVDQGSAYFFATSWGGWTQRNKITASDGGGGDVFGYSTGLSGDYAIVGAYAADIGASTRQGAAYVYRRDPTDWVQESKLVASDGYQDDAFGTSVAISGDSALIGAPLDGGLDGSAYVFVRSGGVWSQQAKLIAPDLERGGRFGISAALHLGRAVVGAYTDDIGANTDQGSAWAFTRCGDRWIGPDVRLVASDAAALDNFGYSLSVAGDVAIVGAFADDVGGNANQGSAYIFERSGFDWIERAHVTAFDGAAQDQFGVKVAILGDWAVVGSNGADVGGRVDQGAAYLFRRFGGSWYASGKLVDPDGAAYDYFGSAVAISPDKIVVGAYGDDIGSHVDEGSASVFIPDIEATWVQQVKLYVLGGATGDHFGLSVGISGETVMVGAPDDDEVANVDQGSAHVFERSGGLWIQRFFLTAADGAANDHFGESIAISGGQAIVGASGKAIDGKAGQGAAYVFSRAGTTWSESTRLTNSDGAAGGRFGRSVALEGDTAVVGAFFHDVSGNADQGAAYVFRRATNGLWTEQARLLAPDGAASDQFGGAVSLSNQRALVGARLDYIGANAQQGSAWMFELAQLPTITTQPISTVLCPAPAATFGVAAAGPGTMSYRWQIESPANSGAYLNLEDPTFEEPATRMRLGISGATAAAIGVSNVRMAAHPPLIRLRCIVFNECGSASSNPATLTVCAADFNCSASPPTVQDIFDFLAAYFANNPRADFNGSGTISVQDIFDFLAAYFAGC